MTHLVIMPFLPKVHIMIPTSLARGHSGQSYCNNTEHLPTWSPSCTGVCVWQTSVHEGLHAGSPSCTGVCVWQTSVVLGGSTDCTRSAPKGGGLLPLGRLIRNSGSFVLPPLGTWELSASGFPVSRRSSSEEALADFLPDYYLDTEDRGKERKGKGKRQEKRHLYSRQQHELKAPWLLPRYWLTAITSVAGEEGVQ